MSRSARSGFSCVEIDAMLAAAPTRCWRAFIAVCSRCGLSPREAIWLAWQDIDFDHAAIMVVSNTISAEDGAYEVPRPYWPWSRQRVVPLQACASEALRSLRDGPATGPLVFVPDWRLDAVWLHLNTPHRIRTEQLVPGLRDGFRMVQSLARLELARRLDVPLADIDWPIRPLAALTRTWSQQPPHIGAAGGAQQSGTSRSSILSSITPPRHDGGLKVPPVPHHTDNDSDRGAP
ncbi:MAG: hypothetical protein H6812_00340 [Phycisphaeraceae bacterium]|nr:hypothetical protein [Phycisphaerales bacterium]MCB9841686.1 hypothetical protein [Phycisphaeraceae bacterium]